MKYRVLLAEDDGGEDMKYVLDIYGYETLLYQNPLPLIHDVYDGLDYDIAIIDLSLPDRDGEEVISILKEVNPKKPVLAFTGYTLKTAKLADYVICKPASVEAIIRQINQHLPSD